MKHCDSNRESLHRLVDGEIHGTEREALDRHLEGCPGCRAFVEDLRALRGSLSRLDAEPFPPEALEAVWTRTVGARRRRTLPRPAAWVIPAAAAVALALLAPALFRGPKPPDSTESYSPADLARAERDAQVAIALVGQAIRRGESAARDRILAGHLAPALRKLPFRSPADPPPAARRDRT